MNLARSLAEAVLMFEHVHSDARIGPLLKVPQVLPANELLSSRYNDHINFDLNLFSLLDILPTNGAVLIIFFIFCRRRCLLLLLLLSLSLFGYLVSEYEQSVCGAWFLQDTSHRQAQPWECKNGFIVHVFVTLPALCLLPALDPLHSDEKSAVMRSALAHQSRAPRSPVLDPCSRVRRCVLLWTLQSLVICVYRTFAVGGCRRGT